MYILDNKRRFIMERTFVITALLATALLAGCKPQAEGVGPAEKAGRAIDDAGARVAGKVQEQVAKADAAAAQARDNAKEATAEASRSLDKATETVGKKVEQAGEKIQQAAH
jgi:predicted small secreted protein